MNNWKLPKWAVVIAAALILLPLAVDWVPPGDGARLAYDVLRGTGGLPTAECFPLWRWLVGLAGRDVAALGSISLGAGLVCVWLVAAIVGAIFDAAVRGAKAGGVSDGENYRFVESAAVLLAGLAFALTPGFLAAATRVSPLMVALVPGLAAAALAVRPSKGRLLLAAGLAACSAYELVLARRVFLSLAFPAVGVWLAVGVLPALVIAWCVRKRWIGAAAPASDEADGGKDTRKMLWWSFAAWAVAVVVMGAANFTLLKQDEGRMTSRIVERIIANAEEGGKVAVVSDGGLDEFFFFMLPDGIKLISLARERDPAYGRELSEWVSGLVVCTTTTNNYNSDLAFAAELGPRALIDEWVKLDKAGFGAKVATAADYFPTRAKWDEARTLVGGSTVPYLRRLMGVCGNALGCRMLDELRVKSEELRVDGEREAWDIFWTIIERVDKENYAAVLNLIGMANRGYGAEKQVVEFVRRRRSELEARLKTPERLLAAARSGGRLYADPEEMARYEKAKREAAARRELPSEVKAFVETVAAASKDQERGKAAQEAIRKAIRDGKVRAGAIGGRLVTIDLALGDFDSAEKDAIDVLRLNRHDPAANAALGSLAVKRGDYGRAERYLRRAIATGKASVGAKNDLAWSLYRLGQMDEAEAFAREAVKAMGGSWAMRETLAAILIRAGKIGEGERELAKAEELAEKSGLSKGKIVSIEIDRARLLKAKGNELAFNMAVRLLKDRKDLTDEQRQEVKGMDW